MNVVGVDPSLTATGLARASGAWTVTTRFEANGYPSRSRRLSLIRAAVLDATRNADLVVVEGPLYGQKALPSYVDRVGLFHRLLAAWDHRETPYAVVAPTSLKLYATGKGNAGKEAVLLAVARRFPVEITNNNEADALTLAAMGHDRLGEPLVVMPERNREALDAVDWPELMGDR